jgi:hypothetical protein
VAFTFRRSGWTVLSAWHVKPGPLAQSAALVKQPAMRCQISWGRLGQRSEACSSILQDHYKFEKIAFALKGPVAQASKATTRRRPQRGRQLHGTSQQCAPAWRFDDELEEMEDGDVERTY